MPRKPVQSGVTLESIGEDRLIDLLTRNLASHSDLVVGPGDDCAVLEKSGGLFTLFKTDCVVEGVHFLPDASPAKIGWKAMARVVSDIAAMGGYPTVALATIILHPGTSLEFARGLYRGFRRAERAFGLALAGGETSATPVRGANIVSISMIGKVETSRCLLRSTAKPGHRIYVTGNLGGSTDGRHLTFRPRLEEARWLSQHVRPSAMMDLSDGLARDLPRLAASSGAGYQIDFDLIPRKRGMPVARSLSEGEDYELLFTVAPRRIKKLESEWKASFSKVKLTCIGEMTNNSEPSTELPGYGWDHFAGRRQTNTVS